MAEGCSGNKSSLSQFRLGMKSADSNSELQ